MFKKLVGGDPVWAELRDGGREVIEGNFPVVLSCSSRPVIAIDHDSDAWLRRLVYLSFNKPAFSLGRLSDFLISKELSGVLNWLLEGYAKLHKNAFQIALTPDQIARTASILLASESPKAFVHSKLEKRRDGVMGVADLYELYQSWCREHGLEPFTSKQFSQIVKQEIAVKLGLKYRHDLPGLGGCVRGWKNLAVIEPSTVKNGSVVSETQVVVE